MWYSAYLRFGEEGLVGYDFLRLSRITYLCYRCGYLSSDECMMLLEHYNEKLKRTYTCYEDIHESYYYGEMFRLKEVTDRSTEITTNIKAKIVKVKEDGFYEGINTVF